MRAVRCIPPSQSLTSKETSDAYSDIKHHLYTLTTGNLASCPKERGAKRVLDVGTGTGQWAIDYGKSGGFEDDHVSF